MDKKTAFAIVLEELINIKMFCGIYDAKHGNPHFMYGIQTVMENIAYSIDERVGDKFSDDFLNNMIKSEKNT